MKKQGFIKNKVMAQLVVASVDKVNWIPHSDVIPLTFKGDDGDDVWQVQSHHRRGVIRYVPLSLNTQVAFANGHCKASFASIKLLLYWFVPTL
jgi:hypothetical protein